MGLYVEALKRIRLPGIILSVILTLEAVLIPLAYELSYLINYVWKTYVDLEQIGTYTPDVVSGSELHILLFLVAVVGAPVFSWVLFSFLNKRNASDYYHSIPHTRISLYLTSVAAIVTWIAAIIIGTSGVSRLTAALFPNVLSVEAGTYFPYMAGCFALALLISACIIIGKSITGTVFSNLVVTALIMFFPRFVMSIVTSAVTTKLPIIPADYVNFLLSPRLNILTGMMTGITDFFYSETPCLFEWTSQVYTVVLALVYIALGAVFFCKRRSEAAQRSAPTRLMQAVYRITLSFAVCVPFCFLIFSIGSSMTDDDLLGKIIFTGIALVLSALTYFIYEIVTTRRWKNLLRAIPGYFIVIFLSAALLGTMAGITAVEKAFRPDADDVTYVQLVESNRYYEDFGKDFRQYVTEETSKLQITDSEAIKTVVNCLDETYDFFNKYGGIDEWYSDRYHGSYVEKEEYAEIYTFKIKTKGGLTKYRNIRLYEDDITVVRESLKKMPGYTDLWISLPEPQRGTVTMDTGRFSITNEQAAEIFETFRREVVSTDFDKWVELNMDYGSTFAYFYYQTASVYLTVPVSTELFPKTVDQLLAYASENSEENMKELEEAMEEYKYAALNYVELMEFSDGYMNHYSPKVSFFDTEELDVIFEAKDDGEFELDDTYLIVEIEFRNDGYDTKEDFKYLSAVIKVKEDSVDTIRSYFGYEVIYE